MRACIAVVAALVTLQCGGKPEQPKKAAAELKPVVYFHPDPATAATVSGRIRFHGARPARQVISMVSDSGCEKAHGGKPVYLETVLLSKNGDLANAFVYIKSGLEGKVFEPVPAPVLLDQHGCLFVPRVIGLRNGQVLDVKNSDEVSHNIHPMPVNNREWSQQQSPGSPDMEHKFPRPEIMIPVKCNVHSWMHAYIGVVEHPYFAVTGADGTYQWANVPPGDYTVAVWHETLGERTKQMHLGPSEHASLDFDYE